MHDESLERRLRGALHDEATALPFTITAAELERRVALRGRGAGRRRLTLLLAAVVAIGVLGVGGLVGGMFNDPNRSPAPSQHAEATQPAPTRPSVPPVDVVALPSLGDILSERGPGIVVFAQTHGPADGPESPPGVVSWAYGPPSVGIDSLGQNGTYDLVLACRGGSAVIVVGGDDDAGSAIACDGTTQRRTLELARGQSLGLSFSEPASWRIVIKRAFSTGPTTAPAPAELEAGENQEELVDLENESVETVPTPAVPEMFGTPPHYGSVPPRLSYVAHASCVGESAMAVAFGDDTGSTVALSTITTLPCDGLAHVVRLGIAEPSGRQVFVGADPVTRWSLLITSDAPPVGLAEDVPGWTVVAGIGPNLDFGTSSYSFAGLAVDGGGRVRVVLACSGGVDTIEVLVQGGGGRLELGTFQAPCAPGGETTSQTFEASRYEGVRVEYDVTAGQWTALSILVPDARIVRQ